MGGDKYLFKELRSNIKECKGCIVKGKNSPVLHFECKDPDSVKILVVSEQPKEYNGSPITEDSIKKVLKNEDKGSHTISKIAELFSPDYKSSIINENGKYYWTHQTKCPSSLKSPKPKCSRLWLKKEITLFTNLMSIVAIGEKAYASIVEISDNLDNKKFSEYLWEEFEIIILGNRLDYIDVGQTQVSINNKKYHYIVLPHVSTTPLRAFIPYLKPLIKTIEDMASD